MIVVYHDVADLLKSIDMINSKTRLLLTLKEYMDMGGALSRGMKLLYPNKKGTIYHNENKYEEVTFIEFIKGHGVNIKEKTVYIGTLSLFLYVEVTLFSNLKEAFEEGQKDINRNYLDWRKECIMKTIEID